MGSLSLTHWVILLVIVLLVFGANRVPSIMGDFAKGIKAFRAGMRDDDDKPSSTTTAQSQIPPVHQPAAPAANPASHAETTTKVG